MQHLNQLKSLFSLRDGGLLVLATLLGILAIGLAEGLAPLPLLVDKFLPDDAFYYFTPASRFWAHGIPTLDGVNPTSGFHPLWFFICAIPYLFFSTGSVVALRLILTVQALMAAFAVALMVKHLISRLSTLKPLAPTIILILFGAREFVNGLETSSLLLVSSLLIAFLLTQLGTTNTLNSRKLRIKFGLLVGILFLARTDHIFAASAYLGFAALFWMPGKSFRDRIGQGLETALPAILIILLYFTYNLLAIGDPLQVSGTAKVFYSTQRKSAALVAANGDNLSIYLDNMRWLFSSPLGVYLSTFYFLGLLGGLTAFGLRLKHGHITSSNFRILEALLPFVIGSIASTIYYHLAFFGPFSSTSWYYINHLLVAIPVFATWASIIGQWLMNKFIASAFDAALAAYAFSLLLPGYSIYYSVTVFLILLLPSFHSKTLSVCSGLLILTCSLIPLIHTRNLYKDGPLGWNYHLYLGAQWAKEFSPPSTTIWSGSSGVLSYFSSRAVTNTDGLANSPAFVRDVLIAGKTWNYVSQFDYAIDAWGVPSGLPKAYPDGCIIELPPSFRPPAFFDGAITRQLTVYKMHRTPSDKCSN